MRFIGIALLFLEVASLLITLKSECNKNNINWQTAKEKWAKLKNLRIRSVPKT